MRSTVIYSVVFLWALSLFGADIMVVGGKEKKGTFEGIADGEYVFKLENGDSLKEKQATVSKLTLENPVEVRFLKKGKSDYQDAKLIGYERLKFSFEVKGKKTQVPRTSIKAIRVNTPMMETGMGAEIGEAPKEIPPIDVSRVENDPNLSEQQKTALANYKAARAKYDAFLTESTELMTKANNAGPAERTEIFNKLRGRKHEEQPIRTSLLSAQSTLRAAFPKGTNGGLQEQKPIDLQKDEVLLIDTSSVEQLPALTDAQKSALASYKAARAKYEAFLAKNPEIPAGPDKAEPLKAKLIAAQRALYAAFPQEE